MKRHSQSGQTLIEVIIAIGLMVLVITTIVSGVVLSIRNNRYAKDQALSKEYVRETLEWLRSMRDQLGWDAFDATVRADGTTVQYCLDTLPETIAEFDAKVHSSTCTVTINGTPFVRSVTLTPAIVSSIHQITAVAVVSWTEGSKTFTSQSTLVLKEWR